MSVLIQSKNEDANPRIRVLYAVAFEKIHPKTKRWYADIIYLHAENHGHAKAQFCLMNPNRRTCHIVAIGPAVGFFVDDNHGDKLTA